MKSLETLIKRQKARVDDQRRVLAAAYAHRDALQQRLDALRYERDAQKDLARQHPECALTFGAYIAACQHREKALMHACAEAEAAVVEASDAMASLFEEQKRYEIAEEQRRLAAQAEADRLEQRDLDEIAGVRARLRDKDAR